MPQQGKWVDIPDPYKTKEQNWVDIPDPTSTPFIGPPAPQQITEPTDFWGGVKKSFTSGEAAKTGMEGGLGYVKGATIDLPGSIWGGLKTAAGLMSMGNPEAQIKAGTELWEGIKGIPSHLWKAGKMSGSDPESFGRMMGQLTGQPIVGETAIAAAPSIIRGVGRPVEAAGRIIREYQPISGFGARAAGAAAGAHLGGPAGFVAGSLVAKAPRTVRNIESGIGGMIERGGQRMRQVGIDPNIAHQAAIDEFWGGPKPNIVQPEFNVIDSSDPFSRTPLSTPVSDVDALREFWGGDKPGLVSPEGITINEGSDPFSRTPFQESDIDALRNFHGGDRPPLIPPGGINVIDASDPFSRTPMPSDVPPNAPVIPPEGMVSMEGRGSIDVQPARPGAHTPLPQDTSIPDLTDALRKELTPKPPPAPKVEQPKVVPEAGLTPEQIQSLLAQGFKRAVLRGKKIFKKDPTPPATDLSVNWEREPGAEPHFDRQVLSDIVSNVTSRPANIYGLAGERISFPSENVLPQRQITSGQPEVLGVSDAINSVKYGDTIEYATPDGGTGWFDNITNPDEINAKIRNGELEVIQKTGGTEPRNVTTELPPTEQPGPQSMWEKAKELARDDKGEVDYEIWKAAYKRLQEELKAKPGEILGRVAQFLPETTPSWNKRWTEESSGVPETPVDPNKLQDFQNNAPWKKPSRQILDVTEDIRNTLKNGYNEDDPRFYRLHDEAEHMIQNETDPAIIGDHFKQLDEELNWTKLHEPNNADAIESIGYFRDLALDKLRQSGDKFGPKPEIPPPDKWDMESTEKYYDEANDPNLEQVPTRPDSPPFPESEAEMSDLASQSESPFPWNISPNAPPSTPINEPGLPFGPMKLRENTQLENISEAPKHYNEGGYPWNEPMQQSFDMTGNDTFEADWKEFMDQNTLPFDPYPRREFRTTADRQRAAAREERTNITEETEEPSELQQKLRFGRIFPKLEKGFYEALAKDTPEDRALRGLGHSYAQDVLRKAKKGQPGITIIADSNDPFSRYNYWKVTYRDNAGKPVAHAELHKAPGEGVKVGSFGADKSRGALYGESVLEMLHAFNKLKVTGATGVYSMHTANLVKHLKKYVVEE